ncbi:MAG: pilA-N [Deltaproteobacteria bacterium]|nr:pilA-N [Deltaproteobacteria bacterium]
MLDRSSCKRGFTLVELLITVALLGVLATIAFAQFAAYRQKGYNSAAVSDLKNAKTVLEAYYANNQFYP